MQATLVAHSVGTSARLRAVYEMRRRGEEAEALGHVSVLPSTVDAARDLKDRVSQLLPRGWSVVTVAAASSTCSAAGCDVLLISRLQQGRCPVTIAVPAAGQSDALRELRSVIEESDRLSDSVSEAVRTALPRISNPLG
jgi:hypothetical protein